jgi:hypothetical protein
MECTNLNAILNLIWEDTMTTANLDVWSDYASRAINNLIACGYSAKVSSYFGDNACSVMEFATWVGGVGSGMGGYSVQHKVSDSPDLVRFHRDCACDFKKLVVEIKTRITDGLRNPTHPIWVQFGCIPGIERDNPTRWLHILKHLAEPANPHPHGWQSTWCDEYHKWSITRLVALNAFDLCLVMFFIRQLNQNPRLIINYEHARSITHNLPLLRVHFQLPRMRDLFGGSPATTSTSPAPVVKPHAPLPAPLAGPAPMAAPCSPNTKPGISTRSSQYRLPIEPTQPTHKRGWYDTKHETWISWCIDHDRPTKWEASSDTISGWVRSPHH